MMPAMQAPPATPAAKRSNATTTVIIVLAILMAVGLIAVAVIGVLAAVGIHGTRKYVNESKAAEGRVHVTQLATGIAICGKKNFATGANEPLPPSSPAVPPVLADVSGKKYASAPSDWTDPAYDCASFSLTSPQYFQYQWSRTTPTSGRAIAIADLDGDGSADRSFEVEVTCTANSCTPGSLLER